MFKMHILFVHRNFPAQFGHIAHRLVRDYGHECTFASEIAGDETGGVRRIQYARTRGAPPASHYFGRAFENYVRSSHAVYDALKARPEVKPDLIVGHSGFGSTVFLADLYDCPIINYCEYYYHGYGSDIDFRPDIPTTEMNVLRSRARNAMLLLDLQTCHAAYSPTEWQRSRFPTEYQSKIETIFDGIDTAVWRPREPAARGERMVQGREIPAGTKVVTYVSRGFESMRGFDIFMRVAKRICAERRDVLFVCVGSDRVCYGGDEARLDGQSFRESILAGDEFDLNRFMFTGRLPPRELARVLAFSDLHIYFTVPFVLSWSMLDAMACGCVVLASDTAPVRELIEHGKTGLLTDFFNVDRFTELALDVLDRPGNFQEMGENARRLIEDKYTIERSLPKMLDLYQRTLAAYQPTGRQPASVLPTAAPEPVRRRPKPKTIVQHSAAEVPVVPAPATAPPVVRLLFVIAHYFNRTTGSRHGSMGPDPKPRAVALRRSVMALHELFGGQQYAVNLTKPEHRAANSLLRHSLDVVICTTQGRHVLDTVGVSDDYYVHLPVECDGPWLGFECQAALRDRLGGYDYYCYMEDDLILTDPWFFAKLRAFTTEALDGSLLQPHRYEGVHGQPARKVYIDGDLPLGATSKYQNLADAKQVRLRFLDFVVKCEPVTNPHAGCYFLNAAQMAFWARQPHFLDRDASFYSPLESAATLGILKTFRMYKPALDAASFLEVQHYGAGILKRVEARDARLLNAAPSAGRPANAET